MTPELTSRLVPGWMLNEVMSAGRENLDQGHVAHYDEKEDGDASSEIQLLAGLGLGGDSVVIDIGAGTGQFSLAVATLCAQIIAVDVSPVMLKRLQSKVDAARLENVTVVNAGFLTYEHSGPPADFVYTRWALHHLPDFWKSIALRNMRRMLKTGGVLRLSDIVFSFDSSDAELRVEQWCATLPADVHGEFEWTRADIEEHIRDEHSTYTWLLEPMIERAGFTIEEAEHSDDGFRSTYIARAV